MADQLTIDRRILGQLRDRYNLAVSNKEESFLFQGNILVTVYAKYVIEYSETKLKHHDKFNIGRVN